jgi:succinate-semialdehyde dehydrogenase / glutarate-semialdehyde dehydrogenase
MQYPDLQMFIDGNWCAGSERAVEPIINPATEEILGELPLASTHDLDRAIASARKGFVAWRVYPAAKRTEILNSAANLIRARAPSIAHNLVLDQGKPIAEALWEVNQAADAIQWAAEEARRTYGRTLPVHHPAVRQYTMREPVGPCAAFTPWNFPIMLPANKIAAALAVGCSIIVKPSEETPSSSAALVAAFIDAGVPDGALNLVFGAPSVVSSHMIDSPEIAKISFTGSTAVGRNLAARAAGNSTRTTMELGGHAPFIVCDDVDLEQVTSAAVSWKFMNAGQGCVLPSRFFIQRQVFDEFQDRFVKKVESIQVGSGLDKNNHMGPLANSRRLASMEAMVADAADKGAKVLCGGQRIGNRGYFYSPTVLSDMTDDMRIMKEEPFGPVAPLLQFDTVDEVIERSNNSEFGLAGYAFTRSAENGNRIAAGLKVGMVGLNSLSISDVHMPFGGVKASGHGYENGSEGLDAYLVTKAVSQGTLA